MKKLLLIFVIASAAKQSTAQTNSYLINNPQWQINFDCPDPDPASSCFKNESYNYYTNGDTIINSLTYKKIFKKGMGYYSWMSPNPPPPPPNNCSGSYSYIDTIPSYFIRSIGKKMFLGNPSDTTEYLLYDFNLIVGDTLPISVANFQNNITVSAIDSIYTPYGYRKRFALTNTVWGQYLIEGIGNSQGLVEPIPAIGGEGCGSSLNCFSMNDTAYYPSFGPTCNLTVGIVSYNTQIFVSISPNPTNGIFTIQISKNANSQIEIYNVYGEKVFQSANQQINNSTIDLSSQPSGIYFLQLKTSEGVATKKLVISH